MLRRAALTLLALATLSACATRPAPDSGFLEEPEKMVEDEAFPFQRVWYDRDVDFRKYTEIMVAPVSKEHLMEMAWWKEVSFPGDRRAGARELALYLQRRVSEAFDADPQGRFKPIAFAEKEPDAHTLVLEMALVELTPTRPFLAVVGGPTRLGKGSVAIEGRLRDGPSDRVVALFTDREVGRQSLIHVKDVTWYAHARAVIDEWAKQLVAVLSAGPEERVQRSSRFTLKPW